MVYIPRYEPRENPLSNHGGTCEHGHPDRQTGRQTDGQSDGLGPFLYSPIQLRWSRE